MVLYKIVLSVILLCIGMYPSARQEKHGGRVSHPYPWYVAQALKRARSKEEQDVLRGHRTVSNSGRVSQLPSSDVVDFGGEVGDAYRGRSTHHKDSYYDSEMLRALARELWTYRASVLSLGNVKVS